MAEIPDMATIFIKQYQMSLYQRGSYHMGLNFLIVTYLYKGHIL